MSDEKQKNKKGLIHRFLVILSWPFRSDQAKRVVFLIGFVIWLLLPLPYLYEVLKTWQPLMNLFLAWLGSDFTVSEQKLFNEVRTIMLIIAAWYGVPFLIWRTLLADRQTQSTEMQTQINRENHYTDLFTKAVEQLGATRQDGEPAIEMRIGAIFALERLVKDSERDYGPIIETLAAYIREHCRNSKPFDDKGLSGDALKQARQEWIESLRENPPADRSDVEAVLTVLSRREQNRHWTNTSDDETQPDFTGTNFQGATLWNKSVGLALEGTNLRLADLSGTDLREADLSGSDLWRASLLGAYLWEANLSGANLSQADLSGANLSQADLSGANLWIVNLSDAQLWEANLSDAILEGANLSDTNLFRANLSGANLSQVDLWSADFSETNLSKVRLDNANLRGTNLSKARLDNANLSGADFEGILLVGTQLKDSKGLTDDMIEKAFGDSDTSLPDGLTRPEHWGSWEDAIEQWRAFREGR